jgi:hypothetical protein
MSTGSRKTMFLGSREIMQYIYERRGDEVDTNPR